MLTGDGKSLKCQVLVLTSALSLTLLLLIAAIVGEFAPAAVLPEIAMPGPLPDGAVAAKGNPADWITEDDYPPEAIRGGHEGTTAFQLGIDDKGRARICRVVSSSGHDSLDEATCRAMMGKADFEPARDADGNPIESAITRRVVWRMPDLPSGHPPMP